MARPSIHRNNDESVRSLEACLLQAARTLHRSFLTFVAGSCSSYLFDRHSVNLKRRGGLARALVSICSRTTKDDSVKTNIVKVCANQAFSIYTKLRAVLHSWYVHLANMLAQESLHPAFQRCSRGLLHLHVAYIHLHSSMNISFPGLAVHVLYKQSCSAWLLE